MSKDKLKKYPSTKRFKIIDTLGVPHSYCITPKHVGYVSDHCGSLLNDYTIKEAEQHGAKCNICKGKLAYDEHKQALLVEVNSKEQLSKIKGLKKYLLSIKDRAIKDGYEGFAFIQKKETK